MSDTAQALPAETGRVADIAAASEAFKAFTSTEQPVEGRPRDDMGRFSSTKEEHEIQAEDEPEEGEAEAEYDTDDEGEDEAAEEAQQSSADMPASWSKEDADLWQALPPEAQAKIAEREGERDRAVNQKFQEVANARKATEAQLAEANANRDQYAQAIDTVLALVSPVEPDPRAYGAGTGNYNREAYDLAYAQYREQAGLVQNLLSQRQQLAAQQQAETERQFKAQIEEIESVAQPRFLADVPDMKDAQKAPAIFQSIVQYAVEHHIPADNFEGENLKNLTSAELHIAWKAMQYDKIKGAQAKVKESPAPAKASPTVKPGVAINRSASRIASKNKAMARLEKSGSVQDAASVFKQLFS